jgi:hypothetical protein
MVSATNRSWKNWLACYPTSSHWYKPVARFERLVSACLSHDADSGRERTIREFITQFDGMSGTAKQKVVLEQFGWHRASLAVLRNGDDLDRSKTTALLAAMQAQTKLVKPAALGLIGKEHLAERFEQPGCAMESFEYRKVLEDTDGLPEVMETAFAWRGETADNHRRLISGVNWSPGIINPFRQLGAVGRSLDSLLEQRRAGRDEPVVILLHLACPRVNYTDRGKSALVIGQDDDQKEDDL